MSLCRNCTNLIVVLIEIRSKLRPSSWTKTQKHVACTAHVSEIPTACGGMGHGKKGNRQQSALLTRILIILSADSKHLKHFPRDRFLGIAVRIKWWICFHFFHIFFSWLLKSRNSSWESLLDIFMCSLNVNYRKWRFHVYAPLISTFW